MDTCGREKSGVAFWSLCAAVMLTAFKGAVGMATGSLGILSEALHSGLDFVAAAITWACVKVSGKPADQEHNFGHGKIENLSALAEAALLLITCAWIIWEAFQRLSAGHSDVSVGFWSFAVVLTSIAVDFTRSRALMRAAKKYRSQALEADALHFSTDILSSSVVLLGLVCSGFGWPAADSLAALGVAAIVIRVSWNLARRAVDELLDKAPRDVRAQIQEIIGKIEGVVKSHDLRVRSSGPDYEIDVNIHVDRHLSIVEAHDISERVESSIRARFGGCTISVHVEPD